jgi:dTDP-4-dehydrorhamnose reductase
VRIAVVGARGQLGAAIVQEFQQAHDTIAFSRAELDAADDLAVAAAMDRVKPEAIVNAAAWTDVDKAEDYPVEALNANAFAVRALARSARQHGAILVHYSSDFVFDGTAASPYTEEDRPNPRSVYAASKLLGEWFALEAPRGFVLRVESLFGRVPSGPESRGSVASILNVVSAGGSPKVFVDRTVSPTYLLDACRATRELIEMGAPAGLYHCVNSGSCTWFEFAQELARQLGIEPRLTPVHMSDVKLRAERPKFCALSNAKLLSLGIEMSPWQDALQRHLRSLPVQAGPQRTDPLG